MSAPVDEGARNLRSLSYANLDGAFATAFITLVSGTFLVGYAKMLGARDEWIGLLGAIPSLVGIFQIPGGVIGRRYASYRAFVAPGGAIWRLLYLPLVVLPMLVMPVPLELLIISVCVGTAWACQSFVNPIYNEWLGELIPAESRGFFFSRRNARMAATGAVVGILGGLVLDWMRGMGREPLGYSLVFGMGMVCAAISMALFYRMDDLRRTVLEKASLASSLEALRRPFADRGFRSVLIFIAVSVSGQMFAGSFFAAYALERLHMPFTMLQGLALTHAIGNVASAPLWGYLSDRYGNRPALLLAGIGITTTPVPWLLCVPGEHAMNAVILIALHLVSGASWAGVILCQFNLILATSPRHERSVYIGAALAVQTIMGGVAPLFGGALMGFLRTMASAQGAYAVLFVANSALRAIALLFLLPVREEGSTEIRQTFKELRQVTPRKVRVIRRRSKRGKRKTNARD